MIFYHPQANPQVFGGSPTSGTMQFDQGWDATSQRNYKTADDVAASGYLYSHSLKSRVNLWITDLQASFSIAGSTGQSRMRREFFPRNFKDVSLQVTGNTPTTQEYNRLAAFVRQSQWQSLMNPAPGLTSQQAMQFVLFDRTPAAWKDPSAQNSQKQIGRLRTHVKGHHRPWNVGGYIPHITAGATAHEVAPQFTFQFVVVESAYSHNPTNTGLWSEIAIETPHRTTFLELVNLSHDEIPGPKLLKTPLSSKSIPSAAPPQYTDASGSSGYTGVLPWSVFAGRNAF